jgi:DHA2 family multidrug resistance protein
MQIGEVIMWVGLPQLLVMPFAARLSATVDNRILCGVGLTLFGISCLMNSHMDASTGYDQLLWSQIIRALGQPFIMLTLSNFAMQGVAPRDTASASSLFNMTRNLGGSVGIALLATTLTNREHFHSARIGESVTMLAEPTRQRIAELTQAFIARGIDPATAGEQALAAIDRIVRREAYVMAYNDGFVIMAAILFACVVALMFADKVKAGGSAGGAH